MSPVALTAVAAMACLLGNPAAQSVPMARVIAPGRYDIWVAPPTGSPAQTVLADVEFLPLELAGFAVRDRLSAALDVPAAGAPAAHVSLAEGGSLYLVHGEASTSLLHVRADGSVATVFTEPDAGGPSIEPQVHAVSNASLLLLATTPAAGGDVWLVDLAGGAPRLLSPAGAPAADPLSLRVSAGRAFFVAGGTLYAAVLTAPDLASPVPLGAAGDVTLSETALSANGLSLAAITEKAAGLRHVHVVDASLQPHQVTTVAGQYDTPNYGSPFGPWLALSADGSQVAWRGTLAGASEVFVADVPQPAPLQVTADANFIDTIDNVGVLGFAPTGHVHFMAGELNAGLPGQLGSADLFAALPGGAGSLQLSNVTATSGDVIAPFTTKGDLEVLDAVLDPTGQNLLFVVDPDGGDAALLSVPADFSSGATMLLPPLAAEPELHAAGDSVLVLSQVCAGCSQELRLLSPFGTLQLLASAPAGVTLDRFAAGGGRAAFVASAGPGLQIAARLDLASGSIDLPWPFVGAVSDTLALVGPAGDLVLGVGAAGGPQLGLQLDGTLSGHVVKVPVGTLLPLDV